MSFKISYNDLVHIIESYDYDGISARIIADYLDECDFELDLSAYIWNTLLFNVYCFNTKQEAINYVQDAGIKDYFIWKSEFGIYLEVA